MTEGQQRNLQRRLQDSSETCCNLWFGNGGADKKAGSQAGGGMKMLRVSSGGTRLEMTISEGQLRLSSLESKLERKG